MTCCSVSVLLAGEMMDSPKIVAVPLGRIVNRRIPEAATFCQRAVAATKYLPAVRQVSRDGFVTTSWMLSVSKSSASKGTTISTAVVVPRTVVLRARHAGTGPTAGTPESGTQYGSLTSRHLPQLDLRVDGRDAEQQTGNTEASTGLRCLAAMLKLERLCPRDDELPEEDTERCGRRCGRRVGSQPAQYRHPVGDVLQASLVYSDRKPRSRGIDSVRPRWERELVGRERDDVVRVYDFGVENTGLPRTACKGAAVGVVGLLIADERVGQDLGEGRRRCLPLRRIDGDVGDAVVGNDRTLRVGDGRVVCPLVVHRGGSHRNPIRLAHPPTASGDTRMRRS